MSEDDKNPTTDNLEQAEELSGSAKRLSELDELQQQISKRLKDNRRFLERFLDDDFEDEMEKEIEAEESDDEPFEEL